MDAKTAARIEALTHSQGWDDLTAELEAQEEKFWQAHIAAMKLGKPMNQRDMDRAMGKLEGIRAILRAPQKAARVLLAVNKEQESDAA